MTESDIIKRHQEILISNKIKNIKKLKKVLTFLKEDVNIKKYHATDKEKIKRT